ncbi:transposase (plasmid) [Streptomyces jietaisiensis]|nr:Tn3 family transposase [Streptomyces jietaisiensis]
MDYQAAIPLSQAWGGGLVTSVDGMQFVVPVPSVYARPNPKYFGRDRRRLAQHDQGPGAQGSARGRSRHWRRPLKSYCVEGIAASSPPRRTSLWISTFPRMCTTLPPGWGPASPTH